MGLVYPNGIGLCVECNTPSHKAEENELYKAYHKISLWTLAVSLVAERVL